MKTYLLLGGSGFIGKHLAEKLASDHRVIIADLIENPALSGHKNITFVKLDFIGCPDFTSYLEEVDVVIHLVCTILPSDDLGKLRIEMEENMTPTFRLLDAMVEKKTKKIIFISSGGTVYGNQGEPLLKEISAKDPICHYGILKILTEMYLYLYYYHYGLDYRAIRLGNPYGVDRTTNKKQGIIPILIDRMQKNEPVTIWGDGASIRDYIYIGDAIDGILRIAEFDGGEKIFNLGTGIGHSINEVVAMVSKELGIAHPNLIYATERKCDVKSNVLDISRLHEYLGWIPGISLEEGIQKVIGQMI